jgi:hypothetical protein
MHDRDLLPLVLPRELKRRPDDPLRPRPRINLAGDGVLIQGEFGKGRKGLGQLRKRLRQLLRHGCKLDPGIQILRVLAINHEIDALLEIEWIARIPLARPQADVEVEQLPHPHDRRAVGEPLVLERRRQFGGGSLGGLGGDGAEHRRIDMPQQLNGPSRERIALLAPEIPANIPGQILRIELDLIEDNLRRLKHIHPDAVARQPGNSVFRHRNRVCLRCNRVP